MPRFAILLYGLGGYAVFFATFLYLIGFVSGLLVPVTVDAGGPQSPVWLAIPINVGLIALFAVQHTIMARPWFKKAIAPAVAPPVERTTFVVATCAVFAVMFLLWRPIPEVIWSTDGIIAGIIYAIAFAGWGIVLLSTFLIDHFDLFGLRQTWMAFRGVPYTRKRFAERSLYRHVRHPLMLGFLIAFWATPTMTAGHLLFAGTYTLYVLMAVKVEEHDLLAAHGEAYLDYKRRVPGLIPTGAKRPAPRPDGSFAPDAVEIDSERSGHTA